MRAGRFVPRAERILHAPGSSPGARPRLHSAAATGLVWAPSVHVGRCAYPQGSSAASLVSAEYPSPDSFAGKNVRASPAAPLRAYVPTSPASDSPEFALNRGSPRNDPNPHPALAVSRTRVSLRPACRRRVLPSRAAVACCLCPVFQAGMCCRRAGPYADDERAGAPSPGVGESCAEPASSGARSVAAK